MRATTQRASVKLDLGAWREALTLLEAPLQYFGSTRQGRLEALALLIASRAHHSLREADRARDLAERVRTFAVEHGNSELHALALVNLSRQAWTAGHLPETLERLDETVRLLKGLSDVETLPYTLTNRAEVLIQLGRGQEAEAALQEVDAGIATGQGAFPSRRRRVALLRALRAVVEGQTDEAHRHAQEVERLAPGRTDETGQLGRLLSSVATSQRGAKAAVPAIASGLDVASLGGRQFTYWRSAALLARHDLRPCLRAVEPILTTPDGPGGAELLWRTTALSALAAQQLGEQEAAEAAATKALSAFERLKQQWGEEATRIYAARRDVAALLTRLRGVGRPPGSQVRPASGGPL